jgi:hypothetical protein
VALGRRGGGGSPEFGESGGGVGQGRGRGGPRVHLGAGGRRNSGGGTAGERPQRRRLAPAGGRLAPARTRSWNGSGRLGQLLGG